MTERPIDILMNRLRAFGLRLDIKNLKAALADYEAAKAIESLSIRSVANRLYAALISSDSFLRIIRHRDARWHDDPEMNKTLNVNAAAVKALTDTYAGKCTTESPEGEAVQFGRNLGQLPAPISEKITEHPDELLIQAANALNWFAMHAAPSDEKEAYNYKHIYRLIEGLDEMRRKTKRESVGQTIKKRFVICVKEGHIPQLFKPMQETDMGLIRCLEECEQHQSDKIAIVAELTWNDELWVESGKEALAIHRATTEIEGEAPDA
jgi:hypothetical protein